jgi:hypothetical protein
MPHILAKPDLRKQRPARHQSLARAATGSRSEAGRHETKCHTDQARATQCQHDRPIRTDQREIAADRIEDRTEAYCDSDTGGSPKRANQHRLYEELLQDIRAPTAMRTPISATRSETTPA